MTPQSKPKLDVFDHRPREDCSRATTENVIAAGAVILLYRPAGLIPVR